MNRRRDLTFGNPVAVGPQAKRSPVVSRGMSLTGSTGFTLIELLVVIAVIALLMAILMPALQKAREQARVVACKSNLHQFAVAIRMYLDDYDLTFPSSYTWLNEGARYHEPIEDPNGPLWHYLADKGLLVCPTFAVYATALSRPDVFFSYTMNGRLTHKKENDVGRPGEICVFAEENLYPIPGFSDRGINNSDLSIPSSFPQDVCDTFGAFHNPPGGDITRGLSNLLFVDGHVGHVWQREFVGEDGVDMVRFVQWSR